MKKSNTGLRDRYAKGLSPTSTPAGIPSTTDIRSPVSAMNSVWPIATQISGSTNNAPRADIALTAEGREPSASGPKLVPSCHSSIRPSMETTPGRNLRITLMTAPFNLRNFVYLLRIKLLTFIFFFKKPSVTILSATLWTSEIRTLDG